MCVPTYDSKKEAASKKEVLFFRVVHGAYISLYVVCEFRRVCMCVLAWRSSVQPSLLFYHQVHHYTQIPTLHPTDHYSNNYDLIGNDTF